MEAFTQLIGRVAPLERANVDTDAIIPKQFLKSIKRSGFGPNLFDEWRYLDHGEPGQDCTTRPRNPDFVLNQARFDGATILLAGENFGCGSSREHAVWALLDYGFRVIVAPSFADIFASNCFKNGVLPVALDRDTVDSLFREVARSLDYALRVDLVEQVLATPAGRVIPFAVDAFRRHCLLQGLDEIGMTLQYQDEIKAYERRVQATHPWLLRGYDASAGNNDK